MFTLPTLQRLYIDRTSVDEDVDAKEIAWAMTY